MTKFKQSLMLSAILSVLSLSAYAEEPVLTKNEVSVAPGAAPADVAKTQPAPTMEEIRPTGLDKGALKNLEEVHKINMDVMVMDARLKKLEAEAKIQTKESEIKKLKGQKSEVEVSTVYGVPTFKSIEGVNNRLFAIVEFPNGGGEFEVSEGETLPNGMKVSKIANGRVEVMQGKKKMRLSKSNGASTTPFNAQAAGAVAPAGMGMGSTGAFIPPNN